MFSGIVVGVNIGISGDFFEPLEHHRQWTRCLTPGVATRGTATVSWFGPINRQHGTFHRRLVFGIKLIFHNAPPRIPRISGHNDGGNASVRDKLSQFGQSGGGGVWEIFWLEGETVARGAPESCGSRGGARDGAFAAAGRFASGRRDGPSLGSSAFGGTGSGSCTTPRTFGLVPKGTLGAGGRRHRTSDYAPGVAGLRIRGHQRVCVNVFVEMTGNYGSENRCNVNGRY